MPNNPFNSDYSGASPTQALIAPPSPLPAAKTVAAVEQLPPVVKLDEHTFKITPISTVSGKPKRLIIRGKVTRD